jgi:hypothetical protein
MNLDKLKSDIANNEICVLVNGQPETVDFKQWCKEKAKLYNSLGADYEHKDIKEIIVYISNGIVKAGFVAKQLYSQLDY